MTLNSCTLLSTGYLNADEICADSSRFFRQPLAMIRYIVCTVWICLLWCSAGKSQNNGRIVWTPRPLPTVGENVTVKAVILYDSSYDEEIEDEVSALQEDNFPHFTKLFGKVQQYFRNQSVMVTVTVVNVTKNNSIGVQFKDTQALNASKTLENLQEFASTQEGGNNTVWYLLTKKELYKENNRGDRMYFSRYDIATQNTFCTGTKSAAVVRSNTKGRAFLHLVAATATIFGSSGTSRFSFSDREIMNTTFSRCGISQYADYQNRTGAEAIP